MVQWLGLHAPNAGGPGSCPGQGTRFHMPQLRSKVLCAATKTGYSQINKINIKKKKSRESQFVKDLSEEDANYRFPVECLVEAQSLSISSQDVCVHAC